MTWVESITRHFIGTHSASGSVTHRQRRWNDLATRFPDLADMSVLDMGGTVESWRLCPTQPARLVLLNTFAQESEAEVIVGDACEPPAALQSQNFDLVFSNSVIEHVGGAWRRQRFAAAVRSLGSHHWIQTPYRYFPVEPHFLCPGLQYMPKAIGAHVVVRWPFGNYAHTLESAADALPYLDDIDLLSRAQMHQYFPESEIRLERFGPLVKSLIAVR